MKDGKRTHLGGKEEKREYLLSTEKNGGKYERWKREVVWEGRRKK